MRPQFADILYQRREQLGLTIPQAASVLRLRESVLVAFEAGDFDHLPPLGYAQGMISSYARYLGLDPARIIDLYEREHSDYVLALTGSRPSGLVSMSDEPTYHGPASSVSSPGASLAQNTQYMDPVAASRARVGQDPYPQSSRDGARADLTSSMRPTNLPRRYNASPGYGVEGSYSATQGEQDSRYAADRRYSSQLRYGDSRESATFEQGYEQTASRNSERRYTSRAPEQASQRTRRSQAGRVRRQRTNTEDYYADEYSQQRRQSSSARTSQDNLGTTRLDRDIETRGIDTQYRDDLRYDSSPNSYRASSTREGREGARNMPMPGRIENARRQTSRSNQGRSRRLQPQRNQGVLGALQDFMADPQRAILSIGLLLGLILLLILVFSVRSCVEANTSTDKQISVVTTLAATTSEAATTTSDLEQTIVADAVSARAASADAAAYTETKVKVSVAEGATTWVEITCDGEQKVAESLTGAWEQEYTVTKSIQIQVVDPSSVTVEKNGEVQAFSSKSAGLSTLTIEGTDPAAAAAATAAATDSSEDSEDDSSDDYSSDDSEE